jgi:hypothetical protein
MIRIFGDVWQCRDQRDDIILGGKDSNDNLKILQLVLQRGTEYNIRFNLDKCKFGKTEIEFNGNLFTSEGLKADPFKIKANVECGRPE